eukprot:TRINITY_DN3908_c0_g1_i2.p1 TRINITY_DN3908_c0_g1~~TRINITY_DN3908_c0_g1_i2.p1  ORF type:complete len:138 (+),score=12.59 TRINITY_DN3908_c0_g1_i2:31-414(+)
MAVLRAIGAVRRIQQAPSLLHSVQQRHFSPLTWLRHKFQLRQLENQWDFDEEEFLEGARSAFTLLQDTIMAGDQEGLKDLKDGLDPAIYSDVLKAIKVLALLTACMFWISHSGCDVAKQNRLQVYWC